MEYQGTANKPPSFFVKNGKVSERNSKGKKKSFADIYKRGQLRKILLRILHVFLTKENNELNNERFRCIICMKHF